jgi:hypothetical protein
MKYTSLWNYDQIWNMININRVARESPVAVADNTNASHLEPRVKYILGNS